MEPTPASRFLSVNGLKLHHLDWGNKGAPPLVYVHGFRGNAHSFDQVATHLRSNFHVVATDVRGRGDSAWSPEGAYEYADYLSDLEGIVDALGLQTFTLIGTSMGGRVAMMYAGLHPERLDRLVINDVGPDVEAGSDRITREAANTPESFASLEEAMAYRASVFPSFAVLNEAERREQAVLYYREAPGGGWSGKNDPAFLALRAQQGSTVMPELWDVLAGFQRPTLVVWGMKSDVLSEDQAKRMIRMLPQGELASVPEVGHPPTLMEPVALDALDRFLAVTPALI